MLDAASTGLNPSAVVAQLAEKYGVTERALWSDWQRCGKWVPLLLDLEKYAGFEPATSGDISRKTPFFLLAAFWPA